jgi:hypothetical protein
LSNAGREVTIDENFKVRKSHGACEKLPTYETKHSRYSLQCKLFVSRDASSCKNDNNRKNSSNSIGMKATAGNTRNSMTASNSRDARKSRDAFESKNRSEANNSRDAN